MDAGGHGIDGDGAAALGTEREKRASEKEISEGGVQGEWRRPRPYPGSPAPSRWRAAGGAASSQPWRRRHAAREQVGETEDGLGRPTIAAQRPGKFLFFSLFSVFCFYLLNREKEMELIGRPNHFRKMWD